MPWAAALNADQSHYRTRSGSMLLHVRPQRPAHHLEGDETVRNTHIPGNGTAASPKEVLSPARNRLPFPFFLPNVGSLESFRQASMTGRTESN
jgi:hypothetical protein